MRAVAVSSHLVWRGEKTTGTATSWLSRVGRAAAVVSERLDVFANQICRGKRSQCGLLSVSALRAKWVGVGCRKPTRIAFCTLSAHAERDFAVVVVNAQSMGAGARADTVFLSNARCQLVGGATEVAPRRWQQPGQESALKGSSVGRGCVHVDEVRGRKEGVSSPCA